MRKHTHRRHWLPGTLLLPQQRDAIVLPAHIALDAIETGDGQIIHRHTLAAFLNICATCAARMHAADETRQMLDNAKVALVSADRRYLKIGRWGFSGQEMLDMRAAVSVADELLKRTHTTVLHYAVEFVGRCMDGTPEKLGTCNEPMVHNAGHEGQAGSLACPAR